MSLVSQSASEPRAPGSPGPVGPGLLTCREATPPLCYTRFSSLAQGSPLPSLPPCDPQGGVAVLSHPPICLAASPATQTPVSRVSPEPCLLHPLHVVSVWAGAGGRAGSIWVDGWGLEVEQAPSRRGPSGGDWEAPEWVEPIPG